MAFDPKSASGANLRWRGDYDAAKEYYKDDEIAFSGLTWRVRVEHVNGVAPPALSTTYSPVYEFVSRQSGGAGAMTGAEIVDAINTELGSDDWQGGSGAGGEVDLAVSLDAAQVTITPSGGGDAAVIPTATTDDAGVMSASMATKLAGIEDGAEVNVATDLSIGTRTNTVVPLNSSTGTDVNLPQATTTLAGMMSGTDKTKLDGIEANADVTDAANVAAAGASMKGDYEAQSILGAITADNPINFSFPTSTLFGRKSTGDICVMTAAEARTMLSLVVGTNVQAWDADLDTWATLTPSANAQSLVTAANYAAMRALLDLEIGTDVQAWDAQLDSLSGASANGVSLVTAADYAAMRTLLNVEDGAQVNVGTDLAVANNDGDSLDITSSTGDDVTISAATDTLAGLMTAAHKVLVDAFDAMYNAGGLRINANGIDPGIEVYTDDGATQANITATTYGLSGGGIFHGRHANGTEAAPTKTLSGDIVGGIGGRAYYSTTGFHTSSPAAYHWVASEDQETSAWGMYHRFLTTPKGSTTRQERVIIADSGTLWVHDTGTFDPRVAAQTKPVSDILALASDTASASMGVFVYGSSLTAGFRGGNAGGTPGTPTATQANAILAFLGGSGYETTGNAFTASKGVIFIRALENFTNAAQGTEVTIETTPTGSTTRSEAFRVAGSGAVSITRGQLSVDTPTSTNAILAGAWGGDGTYNAISLNGVLTSTGLLGLFGGGGSDGTLYFNVPTGANFQFRVNNVNNWTINGTAFVHQTDGVGTIGIVGNAIAGVYLNQGAVINFENSVILTHATNILALSGGKFAIQPNANTTQSDNLTYGFEIRNASGGAIQLGIGYDGTASVIQSWGGVALLLNPQGNSVNVGPSGLFINGGPLVVNTGSVTPVTLGANGYWTLTATANTNFRISYRGSDGVTRVGNITLA